MLSDNEIPPLGGTLSGFWSHGIFSVDSLSSFNLRSAIDGWCAITKHHHDTTACATGVQAKYMTRYGYEHVHGMQETGAT